MNYSYSFNSLWFTNARFKFYSCWPKTWNLSIPISRTLCNPISCSFALNLHRLPPPSFATKNSRTPPYFKWYSSYEIRQHHECHELAVRFEFVLAQAPRRLHYWRPNQRRRDWIRWKTRHWRVRRGVQGHLQGQVCRVQVPHQGQREGVRRVPERVQSHVGDSRHVRRAVPRRGDGHGRQAVHGHGVLRAGQLVQCVEGKSA